MNTSTPATNSSLPEDLLAVYFAQITSISTASFAINIILGLPTNVYILWLIVTEAGTEVGGTMASEVFFLNLAVTEVLFSLSAIFYFIRLHDPSVVVLYFMSFSYGFLFTGRPLFQSCICVERYLAVVHPVVFLKYKPLRYRVGCCGVVWLMVLGSCLFFVLVNERSVLFNVYWGEVLMLFLLKLFCCLSVLRALKRPGPGEGEREGRNDMKMRAFRIILIITVAMIVNYLPYEVFIPLKGCLTDGDFLLASNICFIINVITGLVQPLLYLHRAGKLPCITL
jgi:hypothetical protein